MHVVILPSMFLLDGVFRNHEYVPGSCAKFNLRRITVQRACIVDGVTVCGYLTLRQTKLRNEFPVILMAHK